MPLRTYIAVYSPSGHLRRAIALHKASVIQLVPEEMSMVYLAHRVSVVLMYFRTCGLLNRVTATVVQGLPRTSFLFFDDRVYLCVVYGHDGNSSFRIHVASDSSYKLGLEV